MSFLPDRKSFVGASRHSVSRRDAAGGAPEKTISPGLYEIGKNVFLRVGQDNLSLIAAGVAFYAMTAIFPAIAALVSVYGLFADPHTIERLIASYADLLPANSLKLLTGALENFAGNSHSTLNAALVISVALALWSAKAGVSSLMTGLNIANETAEKRSFIVQQIVALALTIGAAILAIVALASVALIPAILGFLPLTEGVKTVLGLATVAPSCDSCLPGSGGRLSAWPLHRASRVEMGHLGRGNCDGSLAGGFRSLFLLCFPFWRLRRDLWRARRACHPAALVLAERARGSGRRGNRRRTGRLRRRTFEAVARKRRGRLPEKLGNEWAPSRVLLPAFEFIRKGGTWPGAANGP